MKWLEITVTTAPPAAEAVADILLECRGGGVEELAGPRGTVRLRGYLPVGPATDVTVDAVRERVQGLRRFGLDAGPATVEASEVDDAAWDEAWKAHVRPFAVGRLWITPTWDRTSPPEGSQIIELDPGMAFGSGLHPSTQLCLAALDLHLRSGDVVFDVGTGSGILAIAAAKLGASRVLAIDVDPVAVEVARANVAHNGVADRVSVREGNLLTDVEGAAEVVLANLVADIHLDFLPRARPCLTPGGILAASGVVEDREDEVAAVARASGFALVQTMRDGEWRCLLLTSAAW